MLFRQIIGSRETVSSTADDDDVVFALWLRAAPRLTPVAIVAKGIAQQADCRVALHRPDALVIGAVNIPEPLVFRVEWAVWHNERRIGLAKNIDFQFNPSLGELRPYHAKRQ